MRPKNAMSLWLIFLALITTGQYSFAETTLIPSHFFEAANLRGGGTTPAILTPTYISP